MLEHSNKHLPEISIKKAPATVQISKWHKKCKEEGCLCRVKESEQQPLLAKISEKVGEHSCEAAETNLMCGVSQAVRMLKTCEINVPISSKTEI